MKKISVLILAVVAYVSTCSYGSDDCNTVCEKTKEPIVQERCDAHGYYFDRGGRRMFETSYDSYSRGSFNLRRGHLWQDKSCKKERRRHCSKSRRCQCTVTDYDNECNESRVEHTHYAALSGLTRWPTAQGPESWERGTKGYPYVETPIYLRDTVEASGYSTPTSWQGFQ